MREVDGVYGGEMSAHHYFRDFAYCDSGMIPWLLVTQLMCTTGKPLSELVGERMRRCSPRAARSTAACPTPRRRSPRCMAKYAPMASNIDHTDGVSVEFDHWRFNLRSSNTEPLVRLNVESRGNEALMRDKTQELLQLIGGEPG